MNTIITINAGSSSFKLNIFHGLECVASHSASTLSELMQLLPKEAPTAIGHRVVHGGNLYKESVIIDDTVFKNLQELVELAPLHNGPALEIIALTKKRYNVPQIAVFDTAFFATLPPIAQQYALPKHLTATYGIRRFGFHGISHAYLSKQLKKEKVLTLHLGSGTSIAAILSGLPIDTSMGFTPNEGLVMATRCGDLNPEVVQYLSEKQAVTPGDILDMCNHKAGLLGLSNISSNMQELLKQYDTNNDAKFAIDLFCYRIVSYIGAYMAHLKGLDAIVFSGGIGENASRIRSLIIEQLQWYGIRLDTTLNENVTQQKQKISPNDSLVEVWVITSNEALEIAQNTAQCL